MAPKSLGESKNIRKQIKSFKHWTQPHTLFELQPNKKVFSLHKKRLKF